MAKARMGLKLVGVELYFDDLPGAKQFYKDTLGLTISDESAGHFAKFDAGPAFVCVERKGSENYPSLDKAVVFFEVDDLAAVIESLGRERIVRHEPAAQSGRLPWAVAHDPEGHNILLLQAPRTSRKRRSRRRNS